jgi:hypothetical protein
MIGWTSTMHKTSLALLLGTLLSVSAVAATPALYVRGGFNGWGTDHALTAKGNGVYEAEVLLSPGNHPFKVGSGDWSAEWVIDPAASVSIAPGKSYAMATRPGPEDYLFVRSTAAYRFRLDLADPARPQLQVTRLEPPKTVPVNPHAGHAGQERVMTLRIPTFDGKHEIVRFSTPDPYAAKRSYAHSTTQQLRDPGPQYARYSEAPGLPVVRTGNLAFDALFALAATEMRQNSVSQIKDGNYNGGAAIACACFETGEKWHYVWTRDLSYAADLGLAMLDPQRVKNSLEFKLSPWRAGVPRAAQVPGSEDGLQIIQDTGSGGSWPVSTDRVSWAFGAARVLDALPAAERAAFAPRALKALSNTLESDRVAAYDKASGLYQGEQSFLDWRDQSYAAWIVDDLASMASAKALSTNVAHYKAITLASSLANEQGQHAQAARYAAWAGSLKQAINARLWIKEAGMYSSLTAGHFNGAAMHKFDWLGQSLAIVTGVADPARARQILARYPHGPMGAPVIYPQQLDVPVYHNRAIWPFVTAYGLKAATMTGNVSVADAAYDTLVRGAALNLSNMENLEWLSGQPLLLDEAQPKLIGPVINSKRQLWSVGAYLGMVIGDVFGVSATRTGIELRPFITAKLRREFLGHGKLIALHDLELHGKRMLVRIWLPDAEAGNGYYPVAEIRVDGVLSGPSMAWDKLSANPAIDIKLGKLVAGRQEITRVTADPYQESPAVFGPREPSISALERSPAGHAIVTVAPAKGDAPTWYNVYRDGVLAASRLAAGAWTDRRATAASCYAVEAVFASSGNRSHHSVPSCLGAVQAIDVADARSRANIAISPPDARFAAARIKNWGAPGDSFRAGPVVIAKGGRHAVQVRYHNGANQINLGISGGVKWMTVRGIDGRVAAEGVVQLPHARLEANNTPQVASTPLVATLAPGSYSVELSDFYNMSYLEANSSFSAAGGTAGPSNTFDLFGIRVTPIQ